MEITTGTSSVRDIRIERIGTRPPQPCFLRFLRVLRVLYGGPDSFWA